jgi:hypothetical protein
MNITPATAAAAYRKVQPISKMPPIRDYSDKYTFHLTEHEMLYLDNVLQDAERKHMETGKALKELRHLFNVHILPGKYRGLR